MRTKISVSILAPGSSTVFATFRDVEIAGTVDWNRTND